MAGIEDASSIERVSSIEDYALIGDCHTAALVSKNGSIDWLCLPRFDSEACFAALLGRREHGCWQIRPATPNATVTRRYWQDTLILETRFETEAGVLCVIDFMPPRTLAADLVRIVKCERGEVQVSMDLILRFDYGSIVPWTRIEGGRLLAIAGPHTVSVTTPIELPCPYPALQVQFVVREGQQVPFCMTWHPSHESEPKGTDAFAALQQTRHYWTQWIGTCRHPQKWRDAVDRSLMTLKALTYSPTGGILAAATTSLPERPGGPRNWDYRFCWLRDATFTLYSLMTAGYTQEALAWREWLLRAVAGDPNQLQIMYGIAGERRLTEYELPWLPGFENSSPVRVGNAAYRQFQIDVFGEVMDAFHHARRVGIQTSEDGWKVQTALLDCLETAWQQPDEGLWEVRGPRRHFTHSKVMAWVAMDRAVKDIKRYGLAGPLDKWKAIRDAIHKDVCERAYNAGKGCFTQFYGSDEVDASLLQLPVVGFLPINDPRIVGTIEAIERDLLIDGFVYRYLTHPDIDGLPQGEGAFLACSFWLADCYVLQGRLNEAHALFEHLLAIRNDVGLLAEQYEVSQKRMLGNFPQAFSHVGLINTAYHLAQAQGPAFDRKRA